LYILKYTWGFRDPINTYKVTLNVNNDQIIKEYFTTYRGYLGSSEGNITPVANAGIDQAVVDPVNVLLDGSGSSDPDGDAITFLWTQISGPVTPINSGSTTTPDFDTAGAGTYVIQLLVSDGNKSSTDTVTITVT